MMLAFIGFGIFTAIGLLTWVPPLWGMRRYVACVAIVGLSVSTGLVFGLHPGLWSALIVIIGIYQLINLLRLIEGRTRADYLYRVSLSTALWLTGAQFVVLGAAGFQYLIHIDTWLLWTLLGLVQLALALFLYGSVQRNFRTTAMPHKVDSIADRDLPTLTVCIPARNETDDLEACLKNLVHSDYPKLEIIVLDDCSQNKRTPEIIRDFAQQGVRFMSGTVPPESWQAKNHAYQQLAEAANGDILLFCGVDTRFEASTLARMVEVMLHKQKRMVSFLPVNAAPDNLRLEELMVQPGRYAWELMPPRRWLNRPPVLSTCWLMYASDFKKAGTMKAVAHSISSESHFAKWAVEHSDSYSFTVASKKLGFRSEKSLLQQRATAIRTRYPQTHRRPELVAFLSLGEFAILILPFITLIAALVQQNWALAALFALSCVLLAITYSKVVALTYRQFLRRGVWLLPFAAVYDIGLLNYSMWQYEFREVIWKGRNVCVPAKRVIPELPKLK